MRQLFKIGFALFFFLGIMISFDPGKVTFVNKEKKILFSGSDMNANKSYLDKLLISINETALKEIRKHPGVFFRYNRLIESSEFLQSFQRAFLAKYYTAEFKGNSIPVENEFLHRVLLMQEKKTVEVK